MAKPIARGAGECPMRRGVMLCALLLALQGCAGGDVTAPGPRLAWESVPSGTTENLWDVWGSSATDVWAVGLNGTIVHYDGARWTRSLDSVSYSFRGVWGSGPTDVWAVGHRGLLSGARVIFHYDGKGWARDASVADTAPWPPLIDVWGTAASNVWAVGYGVFMHFDGSRWADAGVDRSFYPERIWGTSATDAWTVGPRTILHYDGSGWRSQTDSVLGEWQLSAGWGARHDDQWTAGFTRHGFLHFDGSSWRRVVPDDTSSGFILGMWGVKPSRIWAAERTGSSGSGIGAVWEYDGTRWSIVARDTVNLSGVWASSETDVWVVGDFGRVLHGTVVR